MSKVSKLRVAACARKSGEMDKGFDSWALVELMGHQRIVGHVTEEEIAGAKLLRVDVPRLGDVQSMTKYFGASAIYAITPLEEDTARVMAAKIDTAPVSIWDARMIAKKLPELSSGLDFGNETLDEDRDDGD